MCGFLCLTPFATGCHLTPTSSELAPTGSLFFWHIVFGSLLASLRKYTPFPGVGSQPLQIWGPPPTSLSLQELWPEHLVLLQAACFSTRERMWTQRGTWREPPPGWATFCSAMARENQLAWFISPRESRPDGWRKKPPGAFPTVPGTCYRCQRPPCRPSGKELPPMESWALESS